ncbi:nucleotide-binding oligomerization domain-containing protein 2-like [Sycon ciliatum]|uniref:nucleotide-binding oligomerization domain-containing protein 2-like n=1 Tax=Sycon ciliatum TaxID=27933 RepID=UPI0031F6BC36
MVVGLSLLIIGAISVYYGFSQSASLQMGHAERLLKIRYTKANKNYSPILGASTANTVDNIYINLVMLPKKNLTKEFKNEFQSSSDDLWRTEHAFTSAGQRMQSLNLESLLNNTHQDQSSHLTGQTLGTIVMASAGCGKSFVFTRVAPIKWAAGELWPNKKLLVARELRFPDVHKATSLSKLLGLDGIGIEDSNAQQEICDHVREHPESLVLILDGLDEVSLKDMSSFVYDVLFGKELQGIHLIVTSRPCADIFQLSVLPHFHQHIELMGFKQDDVERYIHSVLSPEESRDLDRRS